MNRLEHILRIARLIGRHLWQKSDDPEIEAWLQESKANHALFHQLRNGKEWADKLAFYESLDTEAEWQRLKQRLKDVRPVRRRTLSFRHVASVAAALCVLLAIAWAVRPSGNNTPAPVLFDGSQTLPGREMATLSSGIATYTRSVAQLLEGSKTKLLDTRKTTPNMRIFEKYAVRVGGGCNHRYNLSDGVLLKDNHIGAAGGIKRAVEMAREYAPFVRRIEVEVESIEMCMEAVDAGADIIMLDNMSVAEMKEAVRLIGGRALTECSGNVTRENIKNIIDTGVDFVSSGALTHSAPILDLSLKNLRPLEA